MPEEDVQWLDWEYLRNTILGNVLTFKSDVVGIKE